MLQVKTKIHATVLTGIIALVFVFMSIIIYLFYYRAHEKTLDFERRIKHAEQSALVDLDHYLSKRLESILTTEAILKAFQNRDREQLYRLTKDRFRILESELPGPVIFHFHTPDTVSFLRLHLPEKYNDDLRDIRPMIAEVNRLQQIKRGFEIGKYAVNYRVATPVTYQGQYLGVLEIGTGVEYIMESIYERFSLPAALYLHSEYLAHYEKKKGTLTTSGENLFFSNEIPLFSNLHSLKTITTRKIQIDNKWYRLHAHTPISNFQGKEIGTLVFLQDIDQKYSVLIKTVAGTIFSSLVILVLVWILLNKFTGKIIDDLIASEKKARQSEEELRKFKIILDNLNYGITTADQDGRIGYINDYFAAIHGYKVQELHGQHLSIFHSDEQMKAVGKIIRNCFREGLFNVTTVWHKHRDGSLFPMEMNGVIIRDGQGEAPFVVGMAVDISERLQLEQKLKDYSDHLEMKVAQRTEELTVSNKNLQHVIKERLEVEQSLLKNQHLLQSILDNSPTFIFSKDLRGRYSLINSRFEELLGKEHHEIIGKTDHDLFPKEVADSFQINDRNVLDNKSTIQVEDRLALKDGLHTYITAKFPLYDDKGIPYGVAGISTDITKRKKMNENISMFKVFADSSSEGMGWTDIDGTMIYMNQALTKLFGEKDKKALLGRNVADCYPDDEQQRLRDEIVPIILKNGTWSGELMLQQKNGKLIPTHNSLFLISNEASEPVFIANIMTDITERKQVEKQIKASLHEKEILLKEIHHRVKNNLQVASSMLYLQANKAGDEDLREVLLNSRDRIKSMALIHETLYQSEDLSRVDFTQYIQTLVMHVFRTYKNRSKKTISKINIEDITLNIEAAIPCGLIINELVSNSFKYAFPEKDGEIGVTMGKEGDQFVLTVSDNGIGFPEDTDFRKSKSLGLQLVTSLVKQLDGTIELHRNHGTKFTIIFKEPTYSSRI